MATERISPWIMPLSESVCEDVAVERNQLDDARYNHRQATSLSELWAAVWRDGDVTPNEAALISYRLQAHQQALADHVTGDAMSLAWTLAHNSVLDAVREHVSPLCERAVARWPHLMGWLAWWKAEQQQEGA